MNILYIAYSCSPDYGSEDAIGWNVPLVAKKRGHQVAVIVRSGLKQSIELWIKNHPEEIFPDFYYIETSFVLDKIAQGSLYTMRLYEFATRALRLAEKLNEETPFDIIHQITPVEFRSIGDYGKIINAKYVIGPIGGGEKINPLLSNYAYKKTVERLRTIINEITIRNPVYRRKIKRADGVLFANRETREYLCEHSLAIGNEILIPEIGVKTQSMQDDITETDVIEKSAQIIFLMVGRLVPRKGFDIVLDALKYIKRQDYKIRICGEGELYNSLLKRIKAENLEKNVELVGFVDYHEMNQEYKKATALIMPSLREATGTVTVEAMQHGIPVITFAQFGAQLIIDDESGWCVPIEDSEQKCIRKIASVMEYVMDHPEVANAKGEKAAKKILEFTWEKKFNLYESVYTQLALKDKG